MIHPVKQLLIGTLALVMSLVMSGCAAESKQPTEKAKAARNWNAARSNVLGNLAADQYRTGNFDKSRQTLTEALKLTPENASLHVLAGKLAIEGGQLEQAEQELNLARQYSPGDGEAYYLSGVVYQRWQKPETAFEFYQKAAARAPAELAYVLAESEMLVAMNRMPEALELLQGKVVYFEHSGAIRDAVGQMLMQAGKYSDAVAMFREASILSEDDASVREHLALALYASSGYRECADILGRLVADKPYSTRSDLLVMLGQCQLHLEDARAARTTFETATQLDANSAAAFLGLGQSALQCGDLHRASQSLTHAIALDYRNSEALLALGYVRLKENKLDDALASFRKASEADARDTVSICMIGYVQEKQGHAAEAMATYQRALKLKAGDEMALQLMASLDLHDSGE